MDKITEYLSSYAASLKFSDLPPDVVEKTKRVMLDTLGCALGGYTSEPSKIARSMAEVTCARPATVIGSGQKTTPDLATFANGVMIRYLDFNDIVLSKRGAGHHSDDIAAVLSPVEVVHGSGRDAITATVLAYEVNCAFTEQIDIRAGGWDASVFGVIACGVAAAKGFGLSKDEIAHTVNLSVVPNMGLFQARIGAVSHWKGVAMANAARNGVFAALLAAKGMTGPDPIFEGPGGLFNAATGPFDLDPFGGDGRPFAILGATLKHFPLGSVAQTAVEAAIRIRPKLASLDDIQEIHVETSGPIMSGDPEKWDPQTREAADHSMPYSVVAALRYGPVQVHHYLPEYFRDPKNLELMQKVTVEVTEEGRRSRPDGSLNVVEVVTKSGERYKEREAYHRGHPKNPMTDEEMEAKFRSMARVLLSERQVQLVLERLWNLEQVDDLGDVLELLAV
jgi:2-methylcitrate dehydratase